MSLRNLLLVAAIFAGLFLAPPDAFAKKRRKENKKAQREQRKKEKQPEDQVKLPPPPARRESPPNKYEMPPPRDPRAVLAYFREMATRSKGVAPKDKPILIEALDMLARIERGRWILTYPPDRELKFEVDFSRGGYRGNFHSSGSRGAVWIRKDFFDAVAGAIGVKSRGEALLAVVAILSHELTHYCQSDFPMWKKEASISDRTILLKIRELHALLEAEQVKDQLLELPAFRGVKALVGKSFFTKLKEAKLKAGASPEEAVRFARTEFVKTFWRDKPGRPVTVGKERIFDNRQVFWNNFYNRFAFEAVASEFRERKYRETGAPIRDELEFAAKMMGVDVTPEFFMNEKAFRYEHGRLIGYADGVRELESDYLTVGAIHKRYAWNRLKRIYVKVDYRKRDEGRFTDYWYGTKRIRATYYLRDGEIWGDYLEYDYNGIQVAEIPFRNGVPNGKGWVLEDGRRCRKVFRNGRCYDDKKAAPVPPRRGR